MVFFAFVFVFVFAFAFAFAAFAVAIVDTYLQMLSVHEGIAIMSEATFDLDGDVAATIAVVIVVIILWDVTFQVD